MSGNGSDDGPLRLDLHVHGERSGDAKGTIFELAEAAQAAGLHGFAITDHNVHWRDAELQEARDATGQLIIPGIEVSSLAGHILALGVTAPIEKRRSLASTVLAIEEQGGVAVPSHPLKTLSGVGPLALEEAASSGRITVAEGRNGRERKLVQANTMALLDRLGLASTGGTDSHWVTDIGACWTEFDGLSAGARWQDVVEAIRGGQCRAAGSGLPRRQVLPHSLSVPFKLARRRPR